MRLELNIKGKLFNKILLSAPKKETNPFLSRKKDLIKKIINGEDVYHKREKKFLNTLKSKSFKIHFYKFVNQKRPLSFFEWVEEKINTVVNRIREKYRTKTRLERVLDKTIEIDKMSIGEKQRKLKSFGVCLDTARDDERSPEQIKMEDSELVAYYKEIGDLLKDDPEYQHIKQMDQEAAKKYAKVYFRSIKKDMDESKTLYDAFYSTDEEYNDIGRDVLSDPVGRLFDRTNRDEE